jgi:hypothetical protein
MNRIHPSSFDPELDQLAQRFAHWRQCRATPKERIPTSLWDQATDLCHTRPPSRVAKRLGLCTSDLKKRCQMPQPDTPLPAAREPSLNFVEVRPTSGLRESSVQFEVQRPDGTRLHLVCSHTGVPLLELVQTLLEVK